MLLILCITHVSCQVYAILDEIFLAGEIEETSKDVVLSRLEELEKLEWRTWVSRLVESINPNFPYEAWRKMYDRFERGPLPSFLRWHGRGEQIIRSPTSLHHTKKPQYHLLNVPCIIRRALSSMLCKCKSLNSPNVEYTFHIMDLFLLCIVPVRTKAINRHGAL